MSEALTNILFPLSAGGAGGFLIGYAIKKIVKILMLFSGLGLLFLYYLAHVGIIEINNEKIIGATSSLLEHAAGFFSATIAVLPFSGSFGAGFMLGIMKG